MSDEDVIEERQRIAELLRGILRENRLNHAGAVFEIGEVMEQLAEGKRAELRHERGCDCGRCEAI